MKIAIRSLALVFVAGLTACTQSEPQVPANVNTPAANETPQAPAENTPVVAPVATETPAAVTPAPVVDAAASGPVGTWKLDGAATFEANRAFIETGLADAPEEQKTMVMGMMSETFNSMGGTISLAADHSLNATMSMTNPMTGEADVSTMTGSWAKVGDAYTLTTREEGNDTDKVGATTIEGDVLKMTMDDAGGPMTFVFQRQS